MNNARDRWTYPLVILSGQNVSDEILVGAANLVGLYLPAEWTTANLTMQVGEDGAAWSNVYDAAGNEVTLTVSGAGTYIALPAGAFNALGYFRLRSGTSGTPVNQGATRTILAALRPFN